jgi:hypothetical protein
MELVIGKPRQKRNRIVADIAGTEVFLESDLPLIPAPETFLCPFLAPAMKRGADLRVPGPIDSVLLENLKIIRRQFSEWWPNLSRGEIREKKPWWPRRNAPPAPDDSALFYTGGVDSSYSLQQLHSRLRYAIFVEGFDIPLADTARLDAARHLLSSTVRERGVEFVTIRTNLREHPVFNEITWETTFVAALAGIAHAFSPLIRRMYVSANDVPARWGSTPELDPYWSSSLVSIEHFGAELTRLDRAISIARWQPIHGRLRVCWKNQSDQLNCGYCEKCVRTRLELQAAGVTDELASFPPGFPLLKAVQELPEIPRHLHDQWKQILTRLEPSQLHSEIEGLLDRSRHSA